MALGAVSTVAGEADFVEVEDAPGSIDGEIARQLFAGMDAVNHKFEVN